MDWYKSAQSEVVQRAPKYHKGQNVIVYNEGGQDSKTGSILDFQYYASEDEYVYTVQFDETDDIFKQDKGFKEKDIIPY
jgi:hypothetical protein